MDGHADGSMDDEEMLKPSDDSMDEEEMLKPADGSMDEDKMLKPADGSMDEDKMLKPADGSMDDEEMLKPADGSMDDEEMLKPADGSMDDEEMLKPADGSLDKEKMLKPADGSMDDKEMLKPADGSMDEEKKLKSAKHKNIKGDKKMTVLLPKLDESILNIDNLSSDENTSPSINSQLKHADKSNTDCREEKSDVCNKGGIPFTTTNIVVKKEPVSDSQLDACGPGSKIVVKAEPKSDCELDTCDPSSVENKVVFSDLSYVTKKKASLYEKSPLSRLTRESDQDSDAELLLQGCPFPSDSDTDCESHDDNGEPSGSKNTENEESRSTDEDNGNTILKKEDEVDIKPDISISIKQEPNAWEPSLIVPDKAIKKEPGTSSQIKKQRRKKHVKLKDCSVVMPQVIIIDDDCEEPVNDSSNSIRMAMNSVVIVKQEKLDPVRKRGRPKKRSSSLEGTQSPGIKRAKSVDECARVFPEDVKSSSVSDVIKSDVICDNLEGKRKIENEMSWKSADIIVKKEESLSSNMSPQNNTDKSDSEVDGCPFPSSDSEGEDSEKALVAKALAIVENDSIEPSSSEPSVETKLKKDKDTPCEPLEAINCQDIGIDRDSTVDADSCPFPTLKFDEKEKISSVKPVEQITGKKVDDQDTQGVNKKDDTVPPASLQEVHVGSPALKKELSGMELTDSMEGKDNVSCTSTDKNHNKDKKVKARNIKKCDIKLQQIDRKKGFRILRRRPKRRIKVVWVKRLREYIAAHRASHSDDIHVGNSAEGGSSLKDFQADGVNDKNAGKREESSVKSQSSDHSKGEENVSVSMVKEDKLAKQPTKHSHSKHDEDKISKKMDNSEGKTQKKSDHQDHRDKSSKHSSSFDKLKKHRKEKSFMPSLGMKGLHKHDKKADHADDEWSTADFETGALKSFKIPKIGKKIRKMSSPEMKEEAMTATTTPASVKTSTSSKVAEKPQPQQGKVALHPLTGKPICGPGVQQMFRPPKDERTPVKPEEKNIMPTSEKKLTLHPLTGTPINLPPRIAYRLAPKTATSDSSNDASSTKTLPGSHPEDAEISAPDKKASLLTNPVGIKKIGQGHEPEGDRKRIQTLDSEPVDAKKSRFDAQSSDTKEVAKDDVGKKTTSVADGNKDPAPKGVTLHPFTGTPMAVPIAKPYRPPSPTKPKMATDPMKIAAAQEIASRFSHPGPPHVGSYPRATQIHVGGLPAHYQKGPLLPNPVGIKRSNYGQNLETDTNVVDNDDVHKVIGKRPTRFSDVNYDRGGEKNKDKQSVESEVHPWRTFVENMTIETNIVSDLDKKTKGVSEFEPKKFVPQDSKDKPIEQGQSNRSRSQERELSMHRKRNTDVPSQKDRYRGSSRETYGTPDNLRGRDRRRSSSRDRNRDRRRSSSRDRLRDRRRSSSRDRHRDRRRSGSRERPRDRHRSSSRERHRDRHRSSSKDRYRSRYLDDSDRRDRHRSSSRERYRRQDQLREKEKYGTEYRGRDSRHLDSRERDRPQADSRERYRHREESRERDRSRAGSLERHRHSDDSDRGRSMEQHRRPDDSSRADSQERHKHPSGYLANSKEGDQSIDMRRDESDRNSLKEILASYHPAKTRGENIDKLKALISILRGRNLDKEKETEKKTAAIHPLTGNPKSIPIEKPYNTTVTSQKSNTEGILTWDQNVPKVSEVALSTQAMSAINSAIRLNEESLTAHPRLTFFKPNLCVCVMCNVTTYGEKEHSIHLNSQKHRMQADSLSRTRKGGMELNKLLCTLCNIILANSEKAFEGHLVSATHKQALQKLYQLGKPTPSSIPTFVTVWHSGDASATPARKPTAVIGPSDISAKTDKPLYVSDKSPETPIIPGLDFASQEVSPVSRDTDADIKKNIEPPINWDNLASHPSWQTSQPEVIQNPSGKTMDNRDTGPCNIPPRRLGMFADTTGKSTTVSEDIDTKRENKVSPPLDWGNLASRPFWQSSQPGVIQNPGDKTVDNKEKVAPHFLGRGPETLGMSVGSEQSGGPEAKYDPFKQNLPIDWASLHKLLSQQESGHNRFEIKQRTDGQPQNTDPIRSQVTVIDYSQRPQRERLPAKESVKVIDYGHGTKPPILKEESSSVLDAETRTPGRARSENTASRTNQKTGVWWDAGPFNPERGGAREFQTEPGEYWDAGPDTRDMNVPSDKGLGYGKTALPTQKDRLDNRPRGSLEEAMSHLTGVDLTSVGQPSRISELKHKILQKMSEHPGRRWKMASSEEHTVRSGELHQGRNPQDRDPGLHPGMSQRGPGPGAMPPTSSQNLDKPSDRAMAPHSQASSSGTSFQRMAPGDISSTLAATASSLSQIREKFQTHWSTDPVNVSSRESPADPHSKMPPCPPPPMPPSIKADNFDSEEGMRAKEHYKFQISSYIVAALKHYQSPQCPEGRITKPDDFRYLARKLTHEALNSELRFCRRINDLELNRESVDRAKNLVRSYMSSFGPVYTNIPSP